MCVYKSCLITSQLLHPLVTLTLFLIHIYLKNDSKFTIKYVGSSVNLDLKAN